ncbi:MAG: hypothetical protein HZA79_16810 [Sphingobacteriales bacterium]|nr:hypothetical protein [Sphingobacteriales bacterium]
MRPIFYFALVITIFTIVGCSSFRKLLVERGDSKEAIQNAILDFSKSCKLYKKDSVFSISAMLLEDNDELLVVRIGKFGSKLLLRDSVKAGSYGLFPSRYFEKDGKLFFWRDKSFPLTKEVLSVLTKYNLILFGKKGDNQYPEYIIDERQKAAHYYFCKGNLAKYKRVVTNVGIGYYPAPDVTCGSIENE